MELTSRTLRITNQIGHEVYLPEKWSEEELCDKLFKGGQNFIFEMLEQGFYSDGPVYFALKPFEKASKGFFSKKKAITLFTTFGNAYQRLGENKSSILFKERLTIKSDDYTRLLPGELELYYQALSDKYDKEQLESLSVYHVLFYLEDTMFVDVYSEVI